MMYPVPVSRPGGRSHRGRVVAVLAIPALAAPLLAGAAAPGAADPTVPFAPTDIAPGSGAMSGLEGPVTVTLITGDKVTVDPAGGHEVEAAPGREHVMFQQVDGGPEDLTVMPHDAVKFVMDGRLDERLFDISYLIAEGYDDATRDDVPLLFEGAPSQSRKAAAEADVPITQEIKSLGISAVSWDKDDAAEAWTQLAAPAPPQPGTATSSSTPPTEWWPDGVDKIWLDAKMHVALDESVPQVGAPEAWEAGYSGEGVTVAVLDTGIDTDHPDLAGQVVAAENFTSEDTIADGYGHGTHVASTVAGTGAASDGTYTGVAPDAELMNGKVCNSGGSCLDSWILAGMEWAASNGADVINMSLGCGPSGNCNTNDGTDPLSQAVNTLTEQHDVLFVISAGNDGEMGATTLGAPAVADAALAVAAVDKDDQVADFSARGPRYGDHAVKPDIAAPGVGIVAARSGDADPPMGTPINDRYTSSNGTSMAAPHVAGGAAVLAQRHPDWSAKQLKNALMGTATHLDGHSPFEVGAGRLDVHRAVTQQIHTDTPSVSFGMIEYPYDIPPVSSPVTYRNDGDTRVTLDLALDVADQDGDPAPDRLFTLEANEITVPAGGTASVNVTMTTDGIGVGTYGGHITATNASGSMAVQTAIGAYFEPESYDLTINVLDRSGQEASYNTPGTFVLFFLVYDYQTHQGTAFITSGETFRLPKGDYGVTAYVATLLEDHESVNMVYPRIDLDKDTKIVMDARRAREIEIDVDRPAARPVSFSDTFTFDGRYGPTVGGPFSRGRWYLGMAQGANADDRFTHTYAAIVDQPLISLDVNAGGGFSVDVIYAEGYQNPRTTLLGTHKMGLVHGGDGTPEELATIDAEGKAVVLGLPPGQDSELVQRLANVKDAGGLAVILDRASWLFPCLDWSGPYCLESVFGSPIVGTAPELPLLLARTNPERERLVELARRGTTSVTTHGVSASPYQYNLLFPTTGGTPEDPVYRVHDRDLVKVGVDYRASYGPTLFYERAPFHLRRLPSLYGRGPNSPQRRTEYYTSGSWTRKTGSYVIQKEYEWDESDKSHPQSRIVELAGVIGPSLSSLPPRKFIPPPPRIYPAWVFREGDVLEIRVPTLTDGKGRHSQPGRGLAGYTRLYRNDVLFGETQGAAWGIARGLPSEPSTYRLEARAMPFDYWQISTRVDLTWTFSSAATSEATAIPLMTVRYKPNLDTDNRSVAGRQFSFPVWVERQTGSIDAKTTALTVEASYDGGETWVDTELSAGIGDGNATLTLTHPEVPDTDECVALRANAEDADGNTVEQTIQCAYRLKGPDQVATFASIRQQLDDYVDAARIAKSDAARIKAKLRQAENYQRRGDTMRAIGALENVGNLMGDESYVPDGVLQAELVGAAEELINELNTGNADNEPTDHTDTARHAPR